MTRRAGLNLRIGAALALGASASTAFSLPGAAGGELRGSPAVISGDVIEIQGQRLRLVGIYAPEPAQRCLFRERLYDCGEIARAALLDLTAGVQVSCKTLGPGAGGTTLARCYAGGYDLSEGMVYTGWALADPHKPDRYAASQEKAQQAGHGLWRGRFVNPWDWIAGKRLPEETKG